MEAENEPLTFSELVDLEKLQEIWDSFVKVYPVSIGIIDLDGKVLVSSGWQQVCTDFHRANPETAKRCRESDTRLANGLKTGERYNLYHCKNGMVDAAVPIIIDGRHLANFFAGQFFFKPPKRKFFIKQAKEFGFDKERYLEALDKVPVIPEKELELLMEYLVREVEMLANAGKTALALKRSNKKLRYSEQRLEETVERRMMQLKIIEDFQMQFIVHTDPFEMYEHLLDDLLKLTDAPIGLIGEVFYEEDNRPVLKTYALSNIAWDEETNRLYEEYRRIGFEFRKLDNLFGAVVTDRSVVVCNDPSTDPRSVGTPPGHPPIESFLGIPVFYGERLVGEIGLANREGGFDYSVIETLKPLVNTCGQIIVARQEREARTRAEQQLKEQADRDGLTGVPNRRRFDEYLVQEWKRAARAKEPLLLMMMDIDHFKAFNDTYGHLEGDACLKKVAGILESCMRRPADMVARYGGEEFVCLLPETSLEGALKVVECFNERLRGEGIEHKNSTVSGFVTISTGIATLRPVHDQDPKELIDLADKYLYRAKDEGRNRVVYKDA